LQQQQNKHRLMRVRPPITLGTMMATSFHWAVPFPGGNISTTAGVVGTPDPAVFEGVVVFESTAFGEVVATAAAVVGPFAMAVVAASRPPRTRYTQHKTAVMTCKNCMFATKFEARYGMLLRINTKS